MAQQTTEVGYFIYGIVPGDVEPTDAARGLGDPAAPVTAVTHGDLGALVSEVALDRPLGRPDDLLAYKRLLDETAVAAPVLPVRFGTVLSSRDAVAELLAGDHDRYLAALDELEGRVEYVVRGRYVESAVLTEVLSENPEAEALRQELAGAPESAPMELRMRLGELISAAVEAKRAADTQRLVDALAATAVSHVPRPPTHEQDAAHVAFLVETKRRDEFERAVERFAGDEWSDRVTVRLLGPLAPYDFVGGPAPQG
ncbi:Gas vesicle synthesis protein GvpL/GvpF [Micromonospora pattaloongensis]|uniref:Gas vesicle synthesis protein GvpL/GvpF n=1 Tax=Micromonospora pattaloongensis TaxID=405436 RepID=A0A1H3Q9U3_9ACTN|nr:GvpL/GvpF family gas vesicle protein [Micromonospora pattaloongensis]SDZ10030.1 Gas vesicle synthesis protein GvpL/GvpF [Micromonospora pattaloongensis]